MNNSSERIDLIKKKVKELTKNRYGAHEFSHLERVQQNVKFICREINVSSELIEIIALLHDIVRPETEEKQEHVIHSCKMASKILDDLNFSKKEKNIIKDGIYSHSIHSSKNYKPRTLEAKILFDADKLDGVGHIGIARWFMVKGKNNLTLLEAAIGYDKTIKFMEKHYSRLYTQPANKLLKKRLHFSKKFVENLIKLLK